jgi:hypothetical protein
MNKEKDLLRQVFQNYAAGARRHFDRHPDEEELEQFAKGSLPAEQLEAVQDHLSVCSQCLDPMLDRLTFPVIDPPKEAQLLSDQQIEERWQSLQRKMTPWPAPEPKRIAPSPIPPRRRRPWLALAAAAAVVALVGAWWLFSSAWPRAARPSVNTQLVSLLPDEPGVDVLTRGVGDEAQKVALSPVSDSVLLVLNVPSLADFSTYRVDLIEAGKERPRWSDSSIRPTNGLSFTASFPRATLPPGRYLLRLWGKEGSHLKLIAVYRFRVMASR